MSTEILKETAETSPSPNSENGNSQNGEANDPLDHLRNMFLCAAENARIVPHVLFKKQRDEGEVDVTVPGREVTIGVNENGDIESVEPITDEHDVEPRVVLEQDNPLVVLDVQGIQRIGSTVISNVFDQLGRLNPLNQSSEQTNGN